MLTLDEGAYRIGVQDLATGTLQILSKGRQDESPSFAPNGAMVILAGRERGQGVLQTISIDGQTSFRLNADAGEVREPVWGPFLSVKLLHNDHKFHGCKGMPMKNLATTAALFASLMLFAACGAKPDTLPEKPPEADPDRGHGAGR